MPLHDVKCSECGHIEEIFFLPADRPSSFSCIICAGESNIIPGSVIINMNNRPIEKQLERDAADGLI